MKPFRPAGATVTLSASTTSADGAIVEAGQHALVVNVGSVAAFVAFGRAGSLTATVAGGVPIAPNGSAVIFKGACTRVAVITASGTAAVYVCPGEA